MKQVISVHVIGQCLPKGFGRIACYAYIIRNNDGQLLHESCGLATTPNSTSSTNSVASYIALIRALEWLAYHDYNKDIINIKSNSKLLVSQLNESNPIANGDTSIPKNIISCYRKAMDLISKFYKVTLDLNSNKNKDDDIISETDTKEIEELVVLAYMEAKEKILHNNNKNKQATPFVTAAQLIRNKKNLM